MSQPKSSLSGLRTVKRDFSDAKPSDEPISWPRTQPNGNGKEQRLKDIQAGIEQRGAAALLQSYTNVTAAYMGSQSKRPLPGTADEPPTKKRHLPPGWDDTDPFMTSSSLTRNPSTKSLISSMSRSLTVSTTLTSKPPSSKPKMVLSAEQTHILKLVEEGKGIFYTGSAGTGKSVLLREIIKCLQKRHASSPDAVAITASTGIAACNIGGVTIHSFAGIGTGEGNIEDLMTKVRRNKKANPRWARTKVLIIDEVSMIDGDLFDKLEEIGRRMRKSKDPFGGIQVVVTGDFFQLPPVTKGSSVNIKFAFEAESWNQVIKRTFNLTKVFRQKDQEFVDMLNEMRFGILSPTSIARFRSLSRNVQYDDDIGPTELFPRRDDVERSNQCRMASLATEEQEYIATDGGTVADRDQRDKILSNFMAPKKLLLRGGAQVMLTKNKDDTLVNGSMGKVMRFVQEQYYGTEFDDGFGSGRPKCEKQKPPTNDMFCPVVEFLLPNKTRRECLIKPETWKTELPNGEVQVSRIQLPLILAWAMSIHKSQGQTLERVKVDLARVFEKGQAYVALSRATSLDGLQVLNFDPKKVKAHPKVVAWSKTLETIAVN